MSLHFSYGARSLCFYLYGLFCFMVFTGKVIVDGRVVSKAGTPVSNSSVVEIKAEVPKYVCR